MSIRLTVRSQKFCVYVSKRLSYSIIFCLSNVKLHRFKNVLSFYRPIYCSQYHLLLFNYLYYCPFLNNVFVPDLPFLLCVFAVCDQDHTLFRCLILVNLLFLIRRILLIIFFILSLFVSRLALFSLKYHICDIRPCHLITNFVRKIFVFTKNFSENFPITAPPLYI